MTSAGTVCRSDRRRDREAVRFAAVAGMDSPVLLRATSGTSLYRCGELVIRISAPGRRPMTPEHLLAISTLLAGHGVPATVGHGRAGAGSDGDEITVWDFVPNNPSTPYPAFRVGAALRALHAVPVTAAAQAMGGPVPTTAPALDRICGWVEHLERDADAGIHTGATPGLLRGLLTALLCDFEKASAGVEPVLLHGDANGSNVLWGVLPGPVLCDFEDLMTGPWAWDLTNLAVSVARGRRPPSVMVDLVAGYGKDPTTCPGWETMCHLVALQGTVWNVIEARGPSGATDPAVARELMAWLRAGFPGLPPLAR